MTLKATPFSRSQKAIQRILFFSVFAILVIAPTLLFEDWLARTGMTVAKWLLVFLFSILTTGLAFGFAQSLFGFFVTLINRDRMRITRMADFGESDMGEVPLTSRIALLFPVYNEDTDRFYAGIETTYRALRRTGLIDHFSFFILSDSTNPNRWIEEENRWLDITSKLSAHGQIAYRHRISNINQKSGNVSDFCRRWGAHYDHMICFDADSIMSGQCILKLAHMMEANEGVGIIQTMPGLFGGTSLFARLQQFANRIHGEISGAGLNFWQQSEGNYWGHNAIIRMKPFTEFCTLPELPGPKPLGGRILSHDFVEAALMRKAGYEVWLAYDVVDSFEECPPTLLDFAQRDRRWCQGNLQHTWIALLGRIPFINRIHMLNGIYAYLAAPLWLLFLGVSTLAAYSWTGSGLSLFIQTPDLPFSPSDFHAHGLMILSCTFGMIFLPKLFAIIRLAIEKDFRQRFGGFAKGTVSIFIEVFLFSLLAPTLMLFHSSFVLSILTGGQVGWKTQNRQASHTAWVDAARVHLGHTLIGITWGILAWKISPLFFYWMSPVLLGWIASIPLSVITSYKESGAALRERGWLLTPEEIEPPRIIRRLRKVSKRMPRTPKAIAELRDDFGLIQVVLDPYVNALHSSLMPKRKNRPEQKIRELQQLRDRLLKEGAPALKTEEKARILNDRESVSLLHREIWTSAPSQLHPWWHLAIARQSRRSLFVVDPTQIV